MRRAAQQASGLFLKQLALPIGPEFFEDLRKRVGGDLDTQLLNVIAHVARVRRVIKIGDGDRGSVPEPLGVVEAPLAVVGTRDEDAREGIPGSLPARALAAAKIAWVFMQEAGKTASVSRFPMA